MKLGLRQSIFCLIITPLILVGCVADKGASKAADCGSNQTFDKVSRKCVASSQGATAPSREVPVGTTTTATIAEDSLGSSIILNYTDIDGDLATSCSIVGYDTITFGSVPSCNCSGGFCFATVIPNADHSRLTSLTYTVSDPIDGASLAKTIAISMTNSNDLPVFGTTVVADTTAEDTTLNLSTLPAVSDVDCNAGINDLPNANCPSAFTYQIFSFTATAGVGSPASTASLTDVIKNCMGLNSSAVNDLDCDIVPEANFYGTYDFVYRGNDGWGNSTNTVAVTITVTSVNDGPTAVCSSTPCTITVPEDGINTTPQDPTAIVGGGVLDFEITNSGAIAGVTGITHTFVDVEDTSSANNPALYTSCAIVSSVTIGTLAVQSTGVGSCVLRWTPGGAHLNNNGTAGTFTLAFADASGATTTPFTVNFTVTAKNDDPTATATVPNFTYTGTASAATPFDESPTAFASSAAGYPYQFTILPGETVDPTPAAVTKETLTYTLNTVAWTLNSSTSAAVALTNDTLDTVPFNITGCMGGTSVLDCTIALDGDDGNVFGTITLNYTISDASGGSVTSSTTVTINSVDDAPVACQYSRFLDSPECGLAGCTGTSSPLNVLAPASHTTANPVFWYDSSTATCWKSTGTGSANWTANGQNEVQLLSFTGVPTSGDFTLTYGALTTTNIDFDATAADVKAALEALGGGLSLTNVSVTGTIGTSLTITFYGNVALTNVAQLSATTSLLNGVTTINITPSTTTEGGNSIISNKSINEKDILYIRRLFIDEGGTGPEDALSVTISGLTSSNSILIQPNNVLFSNNGSEPPITARADGVNTYAWDAVATSSDLNEGLIKITPTGTTAGTSTISFDITHTGAPPITTRVSFDVTVNPVSIKHNDWKVIRAAGPTINKYGEVKSVTSVCSYSRDQCNGSACTGTAAPTVATNGGALGAIYLATGTNTCYHHDGADWFALTTNVCPATPTAFESKCSGDGASCIGNGVPATGASGLGHYYFDLDDNAGDGQCYVSTSTVNLSAADWTAIDAPGSATISWENFTLSGTGSISGYWVFRRVAGEEFDYDFPINRVIVPLGTTTYTDNATNSWLPPAPNFAYYYEVRPVVNSIPTKPVESYAQARVVVPSNNATFMSRRIANKLMCAKLLSPSDKTNENRCPYVGPGDSSVSPGYYDIGNDLIVDRYEAGCPYSIGVCDSTTDGHCVSDIATPNGIDMTTTLGSIFYSRSTGKCFGNTGVGVWVEYDPSAGISAAVAGNYTKSEYAPLVFVDHSDAVAFCADADNTFVTPTGYTGAALQKILPSRKQQMAYTQWDTQSLTDASITSLETGLSLNSSAKCNSSNASGLTGYADTETPDSSSLYSLPGTDSSGIRSVATGSTVTASCQSFAGVQDAVGNVAEWVLDTLQTTAPELVAGATSTDFSTSSAGSVLSGANRYSVDIGNPVNAPTAWGSAGTSVSPIGPCNDTDADDDCDGNLTSWALENKFNDAGRFFIPMGLPVHRDFDDNTTDSINSAVYPAGHPLAGQQVGTITSWAKVIGQSSGITSSQLHSDTVDFNIANLPAGADNTAMTVAGDFSDGSAAGLYSFKLNGITTTAVDVGFRCISPIDTSAYDP